MGNWEGIWIDWEGKVDPYYGSVNLSIYNIVTTNDPETMLVSLYCDADCGQKYSFYCKTRGTVEAQLVYSRPGYYFLFIDNPTEEQDYAWRGNFKLVGYSVGATREGFFWEYSSVGGLTSDWILSKIV